MTRFDPSLTDQKNGTDNDGARIQQAIDDVCDPTHRSHGFVVFVPHGEFNLARPLDLHGCASMLGAGTQSTVLQPLMYGTFRADFHRFDRFELDLRGHVHVQGAALSCLR